MNSLKIQQEVLKALCAYPSKVRYTCPDSDHIFLTVDGTVGWVLPEEWIHVNLKGAQTTTLFFSREATITPLNQLKATDEYRLGGSARRYLRTDESELEVYIDTAKLKYFDHPTVYQHPRNPSVLYVTEDLYGTGDPVWVGVVSPVKVKPEEE